MDPFLKDLEDLDASDSASNLSHDGQQDDFVQPNESDYSKLFTDPSLRTLLEQLDSTDENQDALK